MASNAAVEKLKQLGLRHGEKAVVGIAVALFFVFVFAAITNRSGLEFGPEELSNKAKQAETNLSTKQTPESILDKLVANGLKPSTDFEVVVTRQQSKALDPAEYIARQRWVTPEPGAGLIRDDPVLVAPTDLYAFPNRGGYNLFKTDEKGDRVVATEKDLQKRKASTRRGGRSMGGMMGSGMMGSGMMGGGGGGGRQTERSKQEAEERRKLEEMKKKNMLAGNADEAKPSSKEAPVEASVDYVEIVKGLRSIVITGKLDNKQLKANYLAALKNPDIAYPNYKRLDVQRQTLGSDGVTWSDWKDIDAEANYRVLDNLTDVDEELVREDAILEALVDPLPLPVSGYWAGVHVASLVPKERLTTSQDKPGGMGSGMGSGMMGGPGGSGMGGKSMGMMGGPGGSGMAAGGSGMGGKSMGMMGGPGGSGMGGKSMGMGIGGPGGAGGSGMGGQGGVPPGGPIDDNSFPKSEADTVMIRAIDFTVQPGETYRYQVRIVVVNPNANHVDVNPGVDTESLELKSDWSEEPTDAVTMPADVSAYALNKEPKTRRDDQVKFQLVRWLPEDGHTVTRTDDAGPGELIGEYASSQVPQGEGKKPVSQPVDFNSRQFVLDSIGGQLPAPKSMKSTAPFDEPALALVLRPDGSVAIHTQASDVSDPVRIEMDKTYKQELKDAGRRRRGSGGMMGSGMGGKGGMMGSGGGR